MSNQNKSKIDTQYRRLNIYRNKKNRMIYYDKLAKFAYFVDQKDIRFIQLHKYRFQFMLLFVLITYVISNLVWLSLLVGLLVLFVFEGWFRLIYLKKLPHYKEFKAPTRTSLIQATMNESNQVLKTKMFAFGSISVFSLISAFLGEYTPAYFYGMIAISLFCFVQLIILVYAFIQKKKEGK